MFRIGLNVFLDSREADTFQAGTAGTTFDFTLDSQT
jgi:hypothetical protein